MYRKLLFFSFLFLFLGCSMKEEGGSKGGIFVSSRIRLNTIGFLTNAEKKASFAGSCSSFMIINGTNTNDVVYTGNNIKNVYNSDTKENLTILDFSDFKTEGEFSIYIEGVGLSPLFKIGGDIYNEPFKVCMMGMYLWRCGTNVSYTYNGITYSHGVCHKNDGNLYYINSNNTTKDGTGGWHDAGDYNKYVVNAGVTVGVMFLAWEHFKDKLTNITLDIHEKNNSIPDYLDEIKWEIEWLLKMEYPDGTGRVSHKLSTLNFGGFIMPEAETQTRYFCPFSTAATADFVAMLAMAARIFAPYDANFTNKCITAAKRAYNYLKNNTNNIDPSDSAFSTGGYKTGDTDDRLWAASEMWVTLGDSEYLTDFETRANNEQNKIDIDFDWSSVKNIGMISYLFANRSGKNNSLVTSISNALISVANQIVSNRNKHGYGRPLGESYYWGCNGSVARQVVILHSAYKLKQDEVYKETALDAISHLFGRNYYGRSFVTGLGYNPPQYPHDRTSGATKKAWPGRLVGGGWPNANSWVDVEANYEVNEIAINWNAALIYALAWFLE
ncbi:MAG: glycoside hydrolase family 9 protein [Brevinematales bacterium]|nr:glycoside hydrolase family 9 protein [Brevinematales bacterium]